MNQFKLTILLMVAITLVTAIIVYNAENNFRTNTKRLDQNSKEWCLKEGGKPIYIGYSNSWNCEFKKGGE